MQIGNNRPNFQQANLTQRLRGLQTFISNNLFRRTPPIHPIVTMNVAYELPIIQRHGVPNIVERRPENHIPSFNEE